MSSNCAKRRACADSSSGLPLHISLEHLYIVDILFEARQFPRSTRIIAMVVPTGQSVLLLGHSRQYSLGFLSRTAMSMTGSFRKYD